MTRVNVHLRLGDPREFPLASLLILVCQVNHRYTLTLLTLFAVWMLISSFYTPQKNGHLRFLRLSGVISIRSVKFCILLLFSL